MEPTVRIFLCRENFSILGSTGLSFTLYMNNQYYTLIVRMPLIIIKTSKKVVRTLPKYFISQVRLSDYCTDRNNLYLTSHRNFLVYSHTDQESEAIGRLRCTFNLKLVIHDQGRIFGPNKD